MYLLKTIYIFTVFTVKDGVGILQYIIIKTFYLNRKHTFSVIPLAIGKGRDCGHMITKYYSTFRGSYKRFVSIMQAKLIAFHS